MRIINRIRSILTEYPNSTLSFIGKKLNLPSEDVYRYMSNDIKNKRIISIQEVGAPNIYYIPKEIHESLIVLDAIEMLEALGYEVAQWKG